MIEVISTNNNINIEQLYELLAQIIIENEGSDNDE